ncbi:MAG: phage baseplate assembly protein [Planctomycetota bacterium]
MDRVRGLFARGRVERYRGGSGDAPSSCQVGLGGSQVFDGVTHIQPYGFGSSPRPGAEAYTAWPAGVRRAGWAIAIDDRRGRPDLEEGEVVLFNAKAGSELRLAADGSIRVAGDLVVDGNVTASGDVMDSRGTMAAIRQTYDNHTHGTSTGPTTGPTPNFGGGA